MRTSSENSVCDFGGRLGSSSSSSLARRGCALCLGRRRKTFLADFGDPRGLFCCFILRGGADEEAFAALATANRFAALRIGQGIGRITLGTFRPDGHLAISIKGTGKSSRNTNAVFISPISLRGLRGPTRQ